MADYQDSGEPIWRTANLVDNQDIGQPIWRTTKIVDNQDVGPQGAQYSMFFNFFVLLLTVVVSDSVDDPVVHD